MEPRWYVSGGLSLRNHRTAQFLGGFGRYDLWLMYSHRLRIVWGNAVEDWDLYLADAGRFYHDEPERPQGEDLDLIFQYIRLFAPDAAKELRLT